MYYKCNVCVRVRLCVCVLHVQRAPLSLFEPTSLLLGLASLLAWFGVLRYIAYFQSWNVRLLSSLLSSPQHLLVSLLVT